MKLPSVPSRRAFTLIELLVVISIIAILMTLLFPAASSAINSAKRTQAKNDATQIATAISAYISEYGKVPSTTGGQINDEKLMNILAGATATDDNPRQIVFLEVPKAKSGKNGAESGGGTYSSGYKDPWTKEYEIRVDDNYDNVITDGPDGSGDIRKTVVVWSKGDPQRPNEYSKPEKWIKSWE